MKGNPIGEGRFVDIYFIISEGAGNFDTCLFLHGHEIEEGVGRSGPEGSIVFENE